MLRAVYWKMRWAVSRSVFILFIIRCLPAVRHTAVTRKTDLLIEGFPRSGNTFARNAFLLACNNEYVLSSHLHFIANVKRAVQLNKPVLILVRNPIDAVASYLIYEGNGLPAKQAIREYIDFYRYILRRRERVVLAAFEEITESFDLVIERVNRFFGTCFPLFEHTEENVQACIEKTLEQKSPWRGARKKWSSERNASSPVEGRDELKKTVCEEIRNNEELSELLVEAEGIYRSLIDQCSMPSLSRG